MVSPPLSPCPPQAGSWCSRLERRPYVRLIVLGNEPRHANGLGPRIPKLPSEFDLCTNESHPLTRSSPCEAPRRRSTVARRWADFFFYHGKATPIKNRRKVFPSEVFLPLSARQPLPPWAPLIRLRHRVEPVRQEPKRLDRLLGLCLLGGELLLQGRNVAL